MHPLCVTEQFASSPRDVVCTVDANGCDALCHNIMYHSAWFAASALVRQPFGTRSTEVMDTTFVPIFAPTVCIVHSTHTVRADVSCGTHGTRCVRDLTLSLDIIFTRFISIHDLNISTS